MIGRLLFSRLAIGVILIGLTLDYLPFIARSVFPAQAQTTAPTVEADRLLQAGQQSLDQQQFSLALKHLQAALALYRQQRNQAGEGKALEGLGDVYYAQQDYRAAIELHQQALVIWQQTGDRQHEAIVLDILGLSHLYLGELQNALAYFNQALLLWRIVGDSPEAQQRQQEGEANTLNNIGLVYDTLGEKQTALAYYNQSLPILRVVGDRLGEANTLNNIGRVYDDLGEKQTALKYYNQALSIWRTVGNSLEERLRQREGEANTLNNIGLVYDALGEKKTALDYYNQALVIWQAVSDRRGEANTLSNIGAVYNALGERQTALKYYNQALPIQRAVGDQIGEAITLNNIGLVYDALNQKQIALKYYNQSLPILRVVGDRAGESTTLSNIGAVYDALDEKQTALDYYNQALPILGAVGDRAGTARTLNNIGRVYGALGEKQTALDYYNQALSIWYAVGHREGAARTLNNMGVVITAQNQPDLAIVFYKQSVNVYETIRDGIRQLPRESRESYTRTVADTYRNLADLLLSKGRIGEAQQILELLKSQELRDYTRDTRAGGTPQSIALDQSETAIIKEHTTLIAFAQALQQCSDNPTCASSKRLEALSNQRKQQNTAFANLVKTLEAQLKQRADTDVAFINPNDPNNDFRRRAEEIINSQPGTLLIYPLVLDDKMWLLVGSAGPVFTRYEVNVSQTELAAAILAFRSEMKRCETRVCTAADTARVKQISQKLYQWMFPAKLQQELQAKTKQPIANLVFAPDRATRYIPMGALFDGEKYLIERYTVSTIVAASKTDSSAKLPAQAQVLAMGLSNAVPGFNPLPGVPAELNAIVKSTNPKDSSGIFPGDQLLNQAFTQSSLQTRLQKHQILHLATHGKFVPGAIEQSFLVLGDGNPFKIPDIQGLDGLTGVHLVVLSACETALGDRREQDGIEIAGISNAFLQRGAKAVIASLWQVNDPSTSLWMQQFYTHLPSGMTKAQAIQKVQQDFIHGKLTGKDVPTTRSDIQVTSTRAPRLANFAHPYYWAPFILIGNSL